VSGFTGGTYPNPTYNGRHDGHYESVRVTYDPDKISYHALLDLFWVNIDPFDPDGQFCDKGPSYRSAIFVADDTQRKLAEASKAKVAAEFPDKTITTVILPATEFFPVEAYHQDYYKKNPLRYRFYRTSCGRDRRLEAIWGNRAHH
jgi:peptide-methionine (S)-S-oxide reductase